MTTFFWILGATFTVSMIAIIAIFTLFLKTKLLEKILLALVGLSAGAMMGGAFLELLPEAIEELDGRLPYLLALVGFLLFFVIEKFLYWRHCHKGKCETHSFGYINLVGDGLHNFIDGLIIAAAFLVNVKFGIITTIAIILHEIPQEIGDFGVLIYSGFKKSKALAFNYMSAVLAVLGGIMGYFLGTAYNIVPYLLPLAAGGFIYIGAADLLPELKKENKMKKFLISFLMFIVGLALMLLIKE